MIKWLMLVMISGSLFGSSPVEKVQTFLPGMLEPVPFLVDLAISHHFIAKSLHPETTPNLFDG